VQALASRRPQSLRLLRRIRYSPTTSQSERPIGISRKKPECFRSCRLPCPSSPCASWPLLPFHPFCPARARAFWSGPWPKSPRLTRGCYQRTTHARFAGARAQSSAAAENVGNSGHTPMSRPHTFSAHCLPKKLVTAAEAGGKREPPTSFTRKKEAAGSTLPPRREEGGGGKAGYRGERWSIDALETLSYDKGAQHRDRDIALRRPARSHDLLKVRLMSSSHTCVASLWCVCVLVCLRVYEECVCVRTHLLAQYMYCIYDEQPGGQSIFRSGRGCRGRSVSRVGTRSRPRPSQDAHTDQSVRGTLTAAAAEGAGRRRATAAAAGNAHICAQVAPGSDFISSHAASSCATR
jgi:hypothetical protein